MVVLKIACPKCGQRVSGDQTFYGTTVECPVCSSTIRFPENPNPTPSATPQATETPPKLEAEIPLDRPESIQLPSAASATAPAASTTTPAQTQSPPPMEGTAIPLTPRAPAEPVHAPVQAPSPVLSVVSMVLGIVSVMLFCLPGILFGPAAIIAGHVALAKAKRSRLRHVPGRGAAITGLILGYLSLVGFIVALLVLQPLVEWIRHSAPPE
jgi:hypothetical protein